MKYINPRNDRQKQAIASLILGIFSIILLIATIVSLSNGYEDSGTVLIVLTFLVSMVGFMLGFRSRRSFSGRGMAIAGITLSALPFIGTIIVFMMSVLIYLLSIPA